MGQSGGKICSERRVWHIYQRARHGFVIFYSARDCLVFFTILSTTAIRHSLKILGLCLMFNHIHIIVEASDKARIKPFMRDAISLFVRAYNKRHGISGQLFSRYGIALKKGNKAIRTTLAYLYNNPVEDGLCRKAEEWQWNFLAYSLSQCPFSEKITLKNISRKLRRSIEQAKELRKTKRILGYEAIDRLCDELDISEKKQMVDFIINLYSTIDFNSAAAFYGSRENMTQAFAYNTGSEYDIEEAFENHSGPSYKKMSQYASKDIHNLLCQPLQIRERYLAELLRNCHVKRHHALKFLHLDDEEP